MSSISPLPHRILVVDDDAGLRMLIAGYLARNGCIAETAGDTQAMRMRLARARFDLVLLDLMIRGEDGLTALKRLRADGASTPVIVLSAAGGDIDRIVAHRLGARAYLAKPCNPRDLLAQIRAVLGAGHAPSARIAS